MGGDGHVNMSNYKLICLDLDGTLFNSDHKLCKRTVLKLREAESKGYKIAIVTGRAPFEAQYYANQVSPNAYFIGANGAYVGSPHQDGPISETSFTVAQRKALLEILMTHKAEPAFSVKDAIHVVGVVKHWFYKRHSKKEDNDNRSQHLHYLSAKRALKTFLENENELHKCVFFVSRTRKREKLEKALRAHPDFETVVTSRYVIEVTPIGVNKAFGISHLIAHLDILPEEVIAFGDSENDLEMLKYVGLGIAMGNATEHLKANANAITKTNDEAGIAEALEPILK